MLHAHTGRSLQAERCLGTRCLLPACMGKSLWAERCLGTGCLLPARIERSLRLKMFWLLHSPAWWWRLSGGDQQKL